MLRQNHGCDHLKTLPVCNVEQQKSDKGSVLTFWKRILQVRRQYADLLVFGQHDDLDVENPDCYVFSKTWKGKKAVAICNFTDKALAVQFPQPVQNEKMELLVSSVSAPIAQELAAYEGRIYLVS